MTETLRVVGFSGGADSQACALWVRQRFPPDEVLLLNSEAEAEAGSCVSKYGLCE